MGGYFPGTKSFLSRSPCPGSGWCKVILQVAAQVRMGSSRVRRVNAKSLSGVSQVKPY
jgi:hypothetical protein